MKTKTHSIIPAYLIANLVSQILGSGLCRRSLAIFDTGGEDLCGQRFLWDGLWASTGLVDHLSPERLIAEERDDDRRFSEE